MTKVRTLLFALVLAISPAASASAAAWSQCNDTPVRPKYMPMGISWDLCSLPDGSAGQRAFMSAIYEIRNYVNALGFGAGYRYIVNGVCKIDHGNDRSEVALVNRPNIDGRLGLTISETDGCTFSWEKEHIITADVMLAADLDYSRADESRVIATAPAGTRIGALVALHEFGHAAGIEHSTSFAVMRVGTSRVPFVGMYPGSGGLSAGLMPDDVHAISKIYGFDPSFRNLFVTSQILRGAVLVDNDIDPTQGYVRFPSPLPVCPGQKVTFVASVGNNSSRQERFDVGIFADPDIDQYNLPESEALTLYDVSVDGRRMRSFPAEFTVPDTIPRGATRHVYVAITTYLGDRKGYDNAARSALRIRRRTDC